MVYDLYHDESQESGYWHGMLLVPRSTRPALLRYLSTIRTNTNKQEPMTLKGLRDTGAQFRCIRGWINVGIHAMLQTFKGKAAFVENGVQTRGVYFVRLERPIGARFILFRVRDGHHSMEGFPDYAAKIETTFRMGLKGGLHLFRNHTSELTIGSFHFDGHKHYGRHVDPARILYGLRNLRSGVRIQEDFGFNDGSSDHRLSDGQPYDDCQLLQLTDLLVSGFRTVLGNASNPVQAEVALGLKELATKWNRGYAGFKNSRWFGGFCLSECWLDSEEWTFGDIRKESQVSQLRISLS
jgi:hypothetical protein